MRRVPEYALPPCDEPVDFRRQAAIYARFRRDYSPALYGAIEAITGPPRRRRALDLGCGTGFVLRTLGVRGWRAVGVDFSAPMLAEAAGVSVARGRAEALPVGSATVALVTSGTAFHWFAPAPTLAEIERALVPGGSVALFWRYDAPGQPYMQLVAELLSDGGAPVPALGEAFMVHAPDPFAGSGLVAAPSRIIESELAFTPETFHGYVATLEWVRRLAGPRHADVLERLRAELERRWPNGFRERVREHLFVARKPPAVRGRAARGTAGQRR
jgi:SAM-dependent methyltransferase